MAARFSGFLNSACYFQPMGDFETYRNAEEQAKAEMLERARKNPSHISYDKYVVPTALTITGRDTEEIEYARSVYTEQSAKNEIVTILIGLFLFTIIGVPLMFKFLF